MPFYAHKTDGRRVTCGSQLPATYYDEVDNPGYDPNDPESTPTILVNNFLEMTEGDCPYSKGSIQDNGDGTGTWVDCTDYQLESAKQAVEYILSIVQAQIDKYNAVHNLNFSSIDSMVKYTRRPAYTHLQFVNNMLDWNEDLWEESDRIKKEILAGNMVQPSFEEFKAMLPAYTGVV